MFDLCSAWLTFEKETSHVSSHCRPDINRCHFSRYLSLFLFFRKILLLLLLLFFLAVGFEHPLWVRNRRANVTANAFTGRRSRSGDASRGLRRGKLAAAAAALRKPV